MKISKGTKEEKRIRSCDGELRSGEVREVLIYIYIYIFAWGGDQCGIYIFYLVAINGEVFIQQLYTKSILSNIVRHSMKQ